MVRQRKMNTIAFRQKCLSYVRCLGSVQVTLQNNITNKINIARSEQKCLDSCVDRWVIIKTVQAVSTSNAIQQHTSRLLFLVS